MADTDQDETPLEDELDENVDGDASETERGRRRLESILPKVLKRIIEKGLESGLETISSSSDTIREVMGDNVRLPKEVVGYVFSQIDETKNAMVRVVAHEIRDFLAATDLSKELQSALTSLSFEIRTEIRFVPNEAGGVRPEVKAEVEPKRARRRKRSDEEE